MARCLHKSTGAARAFGCAPPLASGRQNGFDDRNGDQGDAMAIAGRCNAMRLRTPALASDSRLRHSV